MTTELTSTGKLREFVEELKRLKIEVVRPCINNCFAEFKADENKIFYGLGAIKSVGFVAVSNIIKERENNGPYLSLSDFIKRVDPKDVNKLQLEGLVKAGAFDKLEKNRKKIFSSIPKIIQKIKNNYDDKVSNQSSLFENNDELISNDLELEKTDFWTKKELLSEEFLSLGFYISDHPLNEYKNFFSQINVMTYNDFFKANTTEAQIAGTIMSIQEKKSSKGTPFAIVKFSDTSGEFEIFIFSEMLIANREILKESNSFILTLHKERPINDSSTGRINVRKISNLHELVNKSYEKVSIELTSDYNLQELKDTLIEEGKTQINLIIKDKDKSFAFKLEKTRKFDFNLFNDINSKKYVKKISF